MNKIEHFTLFWGSQIFEFLFRIISPKTQKKY